MTGPDPRQLKELADLSRLTQMVLDVRLADLRAAAAACDASTTALQALASPRPDLSGDIGIAASARIDLLYDRWVEAKRADLNLKLARQTAIMLEQRAVAATAFGRNEALRSLADRARAVIVQDAKRR